MTQAYEKIGFGAGCFWCVSAVFSRVPGVVSTEIGYGGGNHPDPSYWSVSANPDGHAEITVVTFDPNEIGVPELLDIFFRMHNPSKSYQINDKKGSLYRSVVLYFFEDQRRQVLQQIQLKKAKSKTAILTEVLPFRNFKPTIEKYQDYYDRNPTKPFCRNVIFPKLKELGLD